MQKPRNQRLTRGTKCEQPVERLCTAPYSPVMLTLLTTKRPLIHNLLTDEDLKLQMYSFWKVGDEAQAAHRRLMVEVNQGTNSDPRAALIMEALRLGALHFEWSRVLNWLRDDSRDGDEPPATRSKGPKPSSRRRSRSY